MEEIKTKICGECGAELPLNEVYFFRYSNSRDGFNYRCKKCLGYKYKIPNPHQDLKSEFGYKICGVCKRKLPHTTEFFHKAGSFLSYRCKSCYQEFYHKVKRKKIALMNKRNKRRRVEDPLFSIKCRLLARTRMVLTLARISMSTQELIGCDYMTFKTHIESLFFDGMNWEKFLRGEIHLDHIIPLSSVDLTNKQELLKVAHYTNIQPMWAQENLSKGSWYNGEKHYFNKH